MRVITGTAKGLQLKAPAGFETRPTADRVKESIFNILGNIVYEADVLDLFAGTGNLGIEALSRGAKHATFIDHNTKSIQTIRENLHYTKLFQSARVLQSDADKALSQLIRAGIRFDMIFCDPPYNKGFVSSMVKCFMEYPVLASGGILVLEHSKHEIPELNTSALEWKRTEKYGETLVSFFRQNIHAIRQEV